MSIDLSLRARCEVGEMIKGQPQLSVTESGSRGSPSLVGNRETRAGDTSQPQRRWMTHGSFFFFLQDFFFLHTDFFSRADVITVRF